MQTDQGATRAARTTKSVRVHPDNDSLLEQIHLALVTETGKPKLKEADVLRLVVTEGLGVLAKRYGLPAPADDAADLRKAKTNGTASAATKGPKKARARAGEAR